MEKTRNKNNMTGTNKKRKGEDKEKRGEDEENEKKENGDAVEGRD